MYCSITQVDSILAQALTTSTPNSDGKVSLWAIGNYRNRNQVSDAIVNQYIRWAQDEIDSNLSEMYRVPFHKVAHGEWGLEQDIDEYNPTNVVVSDATSLVPGDEIQIISTAFNPPIKETHIVATIIDDDEFTTVEPIFTNFPSGSETRVIFIGFPPAITFITARRAAANIYDKYFAAQASPDVSDYGNNLRNLAADQMSDILNGATILWGEDRLDNRFANATLYDRFHLIGRDGNDKRETTKR